MIEAGIVQGLGAAGQFASGILAAKARRAEFDQQIRATKMKMTQTLGTINARASAGGFELGSASTKDYLRSTTNEFQREISFLKRARNQTYMANILSSLSGLAGNAANIMNTYSKASLSALSGTPYTGFGSPGWQPPAPDPGVWAPPNFGSLP